ncbi:N-acetylglutamate synthase, mitochondrial-like [Plakobranchus ocellatus]|uniref:N-acetylglutamate synthase, mitochondrial-like n=1 Tax=Plakobranchus ocellatus TaxID=259542 RepID=A0AAV4DTK9_9GAST|nr:N-acetylglutamate synthase, mitochondrial-like [Plakobranchus ocellatus]
MLRRYGCEMKRFVSSTAWFKGHKRKVGREPLMAYMARNQQDINHSFHTTGLASFSKRSNKNDLSRFLIEIGTDPKEARYWLKSFMSSAEPSKVFMVISVDDDVMQNQAQLETFASAIAFLYRNNMAPLIVYGKGRQESSFKSMKDMCIWNALKFSNMLEQQGVFTRVLYPGCGVITGDSQNAGLPEFAMEQLKLDPNILQSDFHTGHLPILLSYGETPTGQMFAVDTWTLTSHVARLLQPIKVMLVNSQGGFLDEYGKVIANINLPSDLVTVDSKPWKAPEKIEMVRSIAV